MGEIHSPLSQRASPHLIGALTRAPEKRSGRRTCLQRAPGGRHYRKGDPEAVRREKDQRGFKDEMDSKMVCLKERDVLGD